MKTSFLGKGALVAIAFITFGIITSSPVLATVGGPTYIGAFTYNKADESIYFTYISQSGRGCPPVLNKISLVTEKVDTVFSCDQGEVLVGTDYTQGANKVNAEIARITSGFKDVTPINLSKNDIQVDIDFVRSEPIEPGSEWMIQSFFTAKVYQNNTLVDEFTLTGCTKEQPFTIAGYAIPGFEKKLILLVSTKSDCWEGGYTGESLYVIGGIDGVNRTPPGEYKTTQAPLVPSEATLVVFEQDKVIATNIDPAATSTNNGEVAGKTIRGTLYMVLGAIIALIVGLIVGRYAMRK